MPRTTTPASSDATWAETLLSGAALLPGLVGAAVGAGTLLLYLDYRVSRSEQLDARKRRAKRRFLHLVRKEFSSRRDEICEFVGSHHTDELLLSRGEAERVHDAVLPLLEDPEEGRVPRAAFLALLERAGLSPEMAKSHYRVWDWNHDGFVGFHELVRAIGILLHGTGRQKLDWHFDAFDRDRSGFLDREELTAIYRALLPDADDEEVRRKVTLAVLTLDRNYNSVVSRHEFYRIAEHRELESGLGSASGPTAALNRALLAEFGL